VTAPPLLATQGLVVRYGSTTAVSGLDLEVCQGDVIGLIGPDGAGKTSTLRVLGGLLRSSGGSSLVFGRDAWRSRRALHHRLGYMAQRFALYGDLTVDENIQFFALLYGVPDWRGRRGELLERIGLAPFRRRLADRLSGGMRQKLALACTLMHSPEVLLLDEPTTGVDPVTRREFWRLLAELVTEGLTLVVATPYLDEAERCTRVLLMHQGTVLIDASPTTIPDLMPGAIVEVTGGHRPLVTQVLSSLPVVHDVAVFGATVHARVSEIENTEQTVRRALETASAAVDDVRVIPASLEDTFLYLTTVAEAS